MFIVELEKDVWLAQGEGNPCTTLLEIYAWRFDTQRDAELALSKARQHGTLESAKVTFTDHELCL